MNICKIDFEHGTHWVASNFFQFPLSVLKFSLLYSDIRLLNSTSFRPLIIMSAIDSPQRKLRPLIHSWFFAKSKDMPVPILSDLLLCPKTRVESPGVLQCSRWLNLLLTNATPKLVLERKLELANFKRTKKKATMVNDAQSKAILVPAEILVLM